MLGQIGDIVTWGSANCRPFYLGLSLKPADRHEFAELPVFLAEWPGLVEIYEEMKEEIAGCRRELARLETRQPAGVTRVK